MNINNINVEIIPSGDNGKYLFSILCTKSVKLGHPFKWFCKAAFGNLALYSGAKNPKTMASKEHGLKIKIK